MSTKQQLAAAVEVLPDSLTVEEAMERLYRAFKLKQARTRDEAMARLAQAGMLRLSQPNMPAAYPVLLPARGADAVDRLLQEDRGD